jgi:hypothetical protein
MVLDQGDDRDVLQGTLVGERPHLPLRHCTARHRQGSDEGKRRQQAAFAKSRASKGPDNHRLSPRCGSIAGSYEVVNRGDDVEREPGARHDDWTDAGPSIDQGIGVSPDFALIEFAGITAVLE